jgi:hypothetical protein
MAKFGERLGFRSAPAYQYDHDRRMVFVLVGDTGIEPVASTVSTPFRRVDRGCWVPYGPLDQRGRTRRFVGLLTRVTASADFLLTALVSGCASVLLSSAGLQVRRFRRGLAVCGRCGPGAGPGVALDEQVRSGGAPAP